MRSFTIVLFLIGFCFPVSAYAEESSETWVTDATHIPLNWEVTATTPDLSIEDSHMESVLLNLRFHLYRQFDDSYLVLVLDKRCLWDLYHNIRKGTDKQCEKDSYRILTPIGFQKIPSGKELLAEKIIRLEGIVSHHLSRSLEFVIFETRPRSENKNWTVSRRIACFVSFHTTSASKAYMSYLCRNGSQQQFTLPNGDPICVSLALCHEEIPRSDN